MQKKLINIRWSICIVLLLFLLKLQGQQDPQYTQYMYNMNVVNPAYTTNDVGMLNFGTLYRTQWENAVGAPKTLTFLHIHRYQKK